MITHGLRKNVFLFLVKITPFVLYVAKAYAGQEILEIQRTAYLRYQEKQSDYLTIIPDILLTYYLTNYEQIAKCMEIPEQFNENQINRELIVDLIKV